jgi:hypothetical protein
MSTFCAKDAAQHVWLADCLSDVVFALCQPDPGPGPDLDRGRDPAPDPDPGVAPTLPLTPTLQDHWPV